MNIQEIKDLMSQFDQSSLREFTYQNATDALSFSKNTGSVSSPQPATPAPVVQEVAPVVESPVVLAEEPATPSVPAPEAAPEAAPAVAAEGEVVESPLVGVAYLASGPDKPAFVQVGDSVSKGQTLLIIEAMKVMNEVPAPRDGIVTEILVSNEEMVEFGKGLVRIK